ncbi:hypothetical protein RCH09_003293 [Actimicrobium sp. GrIS 1.19]|uniref:hypothetical protein n=1 Tax=Actimicrobium sp. GrIS 1.19 TaxID=3071708 RepID=UPI002DFB27F5|nr:hypothetical protein [Actimicrobium sp. GrIS 1.19]
MVRLVITILWPAFLVAAAATGAFFSLFDPGDLLQLVGHTELPALAAYTLGFFFFWLGCSLAGMLTYYLSHVPSDVHPPF